MASKTVRCHLCQASLEESKIKRHISTFHLNYRPYECITCNKNGDIHRSATEELMDTHIVTDHSATNAGYLVCKEASKESELKAATELCLRLSILQLFKRSASGKGLTSSEMGKNISVQERNDERQTVIDKKVLLRYQMTSTKSASNACSLHFKLQYALEKNPKPLPKTKLTKISIVICIDRGYTKRKKFRLGPLNKYLWILRESKALRDCETQISFEPSSAERSDPETAITAREKFAKFSQEIHSIAHLWAKCRVVAEFHNYPEHMKNILPLSDYCEGLFGRDRSILACKQLEISLDDSWPFSVVTNVAPSKRLILKEMAYEKQRLHCKLLDAIYDKKIPQHVHVHLFLYHNKSTTEFNNELKKRFRLPTGRDFEFKVSSPSVIPYMLDRNKYGSIEIKSIIPQSGQVRFITRITQRSLSDAPDVQPV